ncbi:hypothetical protein UFOVP213_45 [uncultured Caudovirales phage]|uniref:DUF5681 domain-containing protein n=1 Tax=uncultured Caudovirales phage TaxID=2100421 RepID=A0A6J7WLN2_9CAUD|nr:hypothetical protein UFOVP213_45 [uncultured Caudovirales phage]
MANEQNLIPAKKGEIRNPKGRGKGVLNSKTRLLRLLELITETKNPVTGETEEFTIAEQLDMQIIAKARKGDLKAYEILLDRLEGKPKQSTEVEVSGGMTINWEEKKTYVENSKSI